jgi:glycosyltransferase involved in cell wall biosynthesis
MEGTLSLESAVSAAPRRAVRPLRVLVLHQHYWPEIAATAQILSDLCEDLAERGHSVTVVCGQPSYRVLDGAERQPTEEQHRGVRIRRVWSVRPASRGVPARLLKYGSYFASSLAEALLRGRPDVCFVMSTPPLLLGLSATMLRQLRSVPFVYSVQDLYPDIAIDLGVLTANGPLTSAIDLVARQCYRAAAAMVTLSPGMAEKLASRSGASERIHVIPNWADTSTLRPAPRDNAFARAHGLADRFVVQYSGNLGMSQGLDGLIDAAEALRALPIQFAFIGDGNARPSLERAVKERRLANVSFLPPQPRENLSEVLSACDLGTVPMKRNVAGDLVPSKLYGIMAAARPVLASVEPRSEVARVVREHDCGWVVAPESGEALAAGIQRAFSMTSAQRTEFGERGRDACTRLYTREVLTSRYAEVIEASARGQHA